MTTYLIQATSKNKTKFIQMDLNKDTLTRSWGLIDGKVQETANTYGYINKNKSNELTPEAAAQADFDRILKRKTKEGYIQVKDLKPETLAKINLKENQKINLDTLPTQFCCSKPKTKISDRALDKLIDSGLARFYIKYNGLCHYILSDSNSEIKIYTRRLDDHTAKYPKIVQAAKDMKLPPNTLLITELIVDLGYSAPHMTAFKLMSKISKSDTVKGICKEQMPKTIKLLEDYSVRASVFGILYWNNEETWKLPIVENMLLMKSTIKEEHYKEALFIPEQVKFDTASEAREFTRINKEKFEGLVVWDTSDSMEISFNGKPKRRAAYKIKEAVETDVIAYGYIEGSGKLQGKIGSLKIGKFNNSGELVELGTVGSGLQPKSGDCEIAKWNFPCVIEIQYDQIFPDTQKYQFPRFVKIHEDKYPADVDLLDSGITLAA